MSWAQEEGTATIWTPTNLFYAAIALTVMVAVLILVVAVFLLQVLNSILKQRAIEMAEAKGEEYVEEPGFFAVWWNKFYGNMTDAVPVEKEETVLLDHDYDGIRELDNHLPPWWKYLFYLTIVFAVVYLFVYHVIDVMPLQEEEYEIQMAKAEEAAQMRTVAEEVEFDESTVEFLDDPVALANGEQVYLNNCAQCHKENGAGGIGPNLTDQYWIHGGSMPDIYKTIKYGVPEKGMISWEPLLSPNQMRNVASYIQTLVGTNPPNPKAPQGELYTPEANEEGEGDEVEEGTENEENPSDTTNVEMARI
jgi:cytochrome c oxidase cbb3-type subunit 3